MSIKENTEVDKISLRDYFAAKAMTGMLARGNKYSSEVVTWSYKLADEMLKERKQK